MIDYFTIFNFEEREKLFKKKETNSIINQILSQKISTNLTSKKGTLTSRECAIDNKSV